MNGAVARVGLARSNWHRKRITLSIVKKTLTTIKCGETETLPANLRALYTVRSLNECAANRVV